MAFSTAHLYLTFGGFLPGAEQWQCGLRMAFPTGATYADGAQDVGLEASADALIAWFTSSDAGISPRATLEWVKQAVIGTDGTYLTAPGIVEISPPEVGASSAEGGVVPNQISLVATLLTGTSFGDAQRGRIYTPMPATTVGTDGKIASGHAQNLADSVAALIGDLNDIRTGGAPEVVVVMSRKGAGTTRPVTSVSVGQVLDTHRSRRTSLDEGTRAEAAVV